MFLFSFVVDFHVIEMMFNTGLIIYDNTLTRCKNCKNFVSIKK